MAYIRDMIARVTNSLGRIEDDIGRLYAEVRAPNVFVEPPDRSLKVIEAAQLLSCDPTEVRKFIKNGDLRGHKLGKRGVRVLLSSVEEYRDRNSIAPAREVAEQIKARRRNNSKSHEEAIAFLRSMGCIDERKPGRRPARKFT